MSSTPANTTNSPPFKSSEETIPLHEQRWSPESASLTFDPGDPDFQKVFTTASFTSNPLVPHKVSQASPTHSIPETLDPSPVNVDSVNLLGITAAMTSPSSVIQSSATPEMTSLTPTSTGPNPFASSLARDTLLTYAYHLYGNQGLPPLGLTSAPLLPSVQDVLTPNQIYRLRLLPLLITLRSLHPYHLPILLLLSCTYHILGDYSSSLAISREMLSIDPNYVEAMNNIGTTMKALGQDDQAYQWWWKALRSRPTYWDAMENILGLLLSSAQRAQNKEHSLTLHNRALDVCLFVQAHVIGSDGALRIPVLPNEVCRLQKTFYTGATIRSSMSTASTDAVADYFRAIELVINPSPPYPDGAAYTTRELLLASYLAAYLISTASAGSIPSQIVECLHYPGAPDEIRLDNPAFSIFRAVRTSGDRLVNALLSAGGLALPFLFLLPDQVARLPLSLFPKTMGILPGICTRSPTNELQPPPNPIIQRTNVMTSTVLLALAKRYEYLRSPAVYIPGFEGTINVNHSLAILLYYLALSLSPSPSTYNNMGIVLSAVHSNGAFVDTQGKQVELNGPSLARIYYNAGLQMDPSHPHLLTNLGSLYKDQGHNDEAVRLYSKALEFKPDFDIALANLGNAVKDQGRPWEGIEYYRRALQINESLPEATCGLLNAMISTCDWRGRGGVGDEIGVDEDGRIVYPSSTGHVAQPGLLMKTIETCERQIRAAYAQNINAVSASKPLKDWLDIVSLAAGRELKVEEQGHWRQLFGRFYEPFEREGLALNEGGFIIRFINWIQPRIQRRWYIRLYGEALTANEELITDATSYGSVYIRPALPRVVTPPCIPSILPFNTFAYPLSARLIRLISHRNALRISHTALTQPWLPEHVYPPPAPPKDGILNVGYVSNDVNNHPLSHLMLSVFGMHDRTKFKVFLYTTSPWDGTSYRPKMIDGVEVFIDASSWSTRSIVEHIVQYKIHVLINLGGYTKGASNDVFAARPCPVQMQLIGFAGTLGAGWCDYLVCDPIACPQYLSAPELWRQKLISPPPVEPLLDFGPDQDPERLDEDWMFCEKFIYMPYSFMVADHKQSYRSDENLTVEERANTPILKLWYDEEIRRTQMRQEIFPDIPLDTIIFANFNQLYKIDPGIFLSWLRILSKVPKSILWLLRFPATGEEHIIRTAKQWAGDDIASRIRFTNVARKVIHVHRGRVADLFLDTSECTAHTVAADILWSGTPILTWPKYQYKMCSRVAASMANATGFGDQMVVNSAAEYEERAVALANGLKYTSTTGSQGEQVLRGSGELMTLRRNLFLNRDRIPLFDTAKWVRNIEKAYQEAWRRWVVGTQFEMSDEWDACKGPEKESSCIWITDEEPVDITRYE